MTMPGWIDWGRESVSGCDRDEWTVGSVIAYFRQMNNDGVFEFDWHDWAYVILREFDKHGIPVDVPPLTEQGAER